MTMLTVDVEILAPSTPRWLNPGFIEKILTPYQDKYDEVSLLSADYHTMVYYNQLYRTQKGPTDLLSFAFHPEEGTFGGQIIVYPHAVEIYAQRARLPLTVRWAHLIAHGLAHLQGLDHQTHEQIALMWPVESALWQQMQQLLPELRDWTFSNSYTYFYKNHKVHRSIPLSG
jgi:rRNA maturation RNase YbeY